MDNMKGVLSRLGACGTLWTLGSQRGKAQGRSNLSGPSFYPEKGFVA